MAALRTDHVIRVSHTTSLHETAMPATIIDSTIFGNIFSTKAMRDVWSDENRTARYLDVERSLARVQGRP